MDTSYLSASFFVIFLLLVILCDNPVQIEAGFVRSDIPRLSLDGLQLCQANCDSSDRIVGPTKMLYTRQHPWKIAQFPSKNIGFCKLGCQFFFTEFPTNITCRRSCDFAYRYKIPVQYSDIAEEAINECRDGCDIGLTVCQAGYYCNKGVMISCPAGRYREPVPDLSVGALQSALECFQCPYGRYRSRDKGKNANECTLCPIGKYANILGSILVSDCLRCPAGKHAEQEGMRLCKCITKDSCALTVRNARTTTKWFSLTEKDGIDFFRETIPFIGRW